MYVHTNEYGRFTLRYHNWLERDFSAYSGVFYIPIYNRKLQPLLTPGIISGAILFELPSSLCQ